MVAFITRHADRVSAYGCSRHYHGAVKRDGAVSAQCWREKLCMSVWVGMLRILIAAQGKGVS